MAGVESMAPEDAADSMIFSFGLDQEIDQCLQEANGIQRSILSSFGSNDPSGSRRELDRVMARLEDEFRSILISLSSISFDTDSSSDSSFSSNRSSFRISISEAHMSPSMDQSNDIVAPPERIHHSQTSSSSSSLIIHPPQAAAIHYLRSIAEQMIASGYAQECIQTYSSIRKAAVNASFGKLGVEKLTIRDIQMLEPDTLEKKIRKWIAAATVCVQELFVSEKRFFEQIFEGSSLGTAIKYTCFMETVNGPAKQLLSFAQAVSSSRRSPKKLFSILGLYNALSDLLPDIGIIFKPGCLESVVVEAAETLAKLADVARVILSQFENSLLHEMSKVPIPGGAIHPMARYVMNYMKFMVVFKQTLTELIASKPASLELMISGDLIEDFVELEGKANLALHFNWITTVLQFKLEEKSKLYKDASLAHLFTMNNGYYMVQHIEGSPELMEMIGDDYLRKLTGKFRLAATNYQRSTWARVLYCLRDEGLHVSGTFSSGVSRSALRERIKTFNAMFKEVHRTQATWLVPDIQLREELRICISEKVIPAYRSFLGRFRSHIESGRHPENYIKYSSEDLEVAVLDFFE